ncbi:hypothetical protein [Nocardioides convexus]|uniref:hypothetical protein n=1 Tax=Nocardioides convexus TaxID=2712224 RepID=UPI00241837B6|nr:hypothetical protein [Nocardioides convexus]
MPSPSLQVLQRLLAGERLPGDEPAETSAETSEDPLADCLRSLVDEGSPAEGDILERMAAARADLGFLDERVGARAATWSTPTGDVLDLLLADLAEPAGSGRHRLALRVLSPLLGTTADRLATAAATSLAPTRAATVLGQTIDVQAGGAVRDWRPDVLAAAARRTPRQPHLLPGGIAALAVGVVAIGLAFVASGFAVLAVAALLGGAAAVVTALTQARRQRAAQESAVRSGERQVAESRAADHRRDGALHERRDHGQRAARGGPCPDSADQAGCSARCRATRSAYQVKERLGVRTCVS